MFLFSMLVACTGGAQDSGGVVGDATAGETVYTNTCASCHGADGKGATAESPTAADLTAKITEESDSELTDSVTNGKGGMPAYGGMLSEQDIADVIAYLHSAFQ